MYPSEPGYSQEVLVALTDIISNQLTQPAWENMISLPAFKSDRSFNSPHKLGPGTNESLLFIYCIPISWLFSFQLLFESINQSVSQSVSQSVQLTVNNSLSISSTHPCVSQSVSQSVNQLAFLFPTVPICLGKYDQLACIQVRSSNQLAPSAKAGN
jgi:hypothetical protein